jgi:hypothetical protein
MQYVGASWCYGYKMATEGDAGAPETTRESGNALWRVCEEFFNFEKNIEKTRKGGKMRAILD